MHSLHSLHVGPLCNECNETGGRALARLKRDRAFGIPQDGHAIVKKRIEEWIVIEAAAETTVAVAHEINNVLTALTMNAELLANDASPEEIPELAAEVLAASNRIAAIVKRLRNVSDLKSVDYMGDKRMLDLSSGPHKAPNAT